jgi:polar amino acid transport system permease protein
MNYWFETFSYLLDGIWVSLKIATVTILGAVPLSILLLLFYRSKKTYQFVIHFYTWFFRGTPLMLQLFFIMYGLPAIGIRIDRMMVAYIAFIINYTAYLVEILRAGVESLPKDQEESASILGASKWRTFKDILLPQAIKIQLPVLTSETITLIKDTALVTVIAISDILRRVKEVVSRDFTITPFIMAAIFYLLLSYVIVTIFKRFENDERI